MAPGSPLVIDEKAARRREYERRVEEHREQIRRAHEQMVRTSVWIGSDSDPTDVLRRMGAPMTSTELESRILRLTSSVLFEDHPDNHLRKFASAFFTSPSQSSLPFSLLTPKRLAYRIRQDGRREFLFAFEKGIMPEYSILRRVTREVWDGKTTHIDRRDLGRDTHPGRVRVDLPWREEVRGWRTVLLRLVECGILTLEQVERAFGPGQSTFWAARLGKRHGLEVI